MKKILNIIFKVFEYTFVSIVVIYVLALILQRMNVNLGGYKVYTVATGSMIPVYDIGEVVIVKDTKPENLKAYDDITYIGKTGDIAGMTITHRITEIDYDKEIITTKGVANTFSDNPIGYDQVVGKVVYKTHLISKISQILRTSWGFFVLVFSPIAIISTLELITLFKEKEEE